MVSYDYIMVRFGELSTKGKNKKDFIHTLFLNIKHALKDYDVKVESRFDHIYVYLNDEDYEPIISRLQDVSGIHAMSLVYRCEKDIEVIIADMKAAGCSNADTDKVRSMHEAGLDAEIFANE